MVDEFGNPLPAAAVDVLFRHSGANDVKPTDGTGTARLDKPGGSSFAFARLSDDAAVETLRTALVPVWNQPRRVQDRRDEVFTEEDDDTSVVFFRSAPPPEAGRAPSPSPLLSREYRLVTGEPHRISIQCPVELALLRGMYFDIDKCFLLPTALPDLTSIIDVYERSRGSALLIVGHTDTSGDSAYNETLSLERAASLAAFLQDRVEDWLGWYDWGKVDAKRWGEYEDSLMIGSFASRGLTPGPNPTLAYQQWHNALPEGDRAPNWETLTEDGKTGPRTRRQLIGDYMNHDRTSLPADVSVTTHGCGENFPLDPSLEELDGAAADCEHDPTDRRVEVFFFDGGLGVQPPPPGSISKPGSPEYREWRARARLVEDLGIGGRVLKVRLHDRTPKPLDAVPYWVNIGTTRVGPRMSVDGWAEIVLPEAECPATVLLEWGTTPEGSPDEFAYSREIVPDCALPADGEEDDATSQRLARSRLQNLGYDCSTDLSFRTAVLLFQFDYELEELGLDDADQFRPQTLARLREIYAEECDATPEAAG
ncbi:MAG: OmpA family protein [Polyangiaceae bacterium]|nr:OmpA family protein [Polyangiaceae bacterium]